mmetsp:Transcript_27029/g.41400  ORF Transcript_27029/g.41400 Transcript_27029/m.41400 type:complete len:292 (-) Transcript_27029:314-1189(-)
MTSTAINTSTSTSMFSSRWSLSDKYIVLTGATKGIGLATLKSLLIDHKPAGIIICSRSQSDVDNVLASSPILKEHPNYASFQSIVSGLACDISTKDGREALVAAVQGKFPRIDCLVNVVGVNIRKSVMEQTAEEYHSVMRTNVDSVYFLCKELLPLLKKAGTSACAASVVNVASAAGVQSSGTGAAYGMSKAAVIHYSKILACEWAKYHIRINAIAPWMTMTPMLEDALKGDEGQLDKVNEWTPMGRIANVQEIVDPILFLLMNCSSYVTGQCLGIDGGLTAQGFAGVCTE